MKIIFFGTSTFAIPSLKKIAGSRHEILLAVTQPDRRKGRFLKLKPPAIKEIADSLGIPVFQAADISSQDSVGKLKKPDADIFVVVAFGQLLSEEALGIPNKFAVNLHASLLPKYRGAAPVNCAVINGEKTTGVTVFRLNEKMDAGDIILSKTADINDKENAAVVSERLSAIGADALIECLDLIEGGKAVFKRQDEDIASFAPKLKKENGLLDWKADAAELNNRVRGLTPWPSAFTRLGPKILKILQAQAADCKAEDAEPGEVIDVSSPAGIIVKAKKGCLAIQRLQLEGSKPMGSKEFLMGHKLNAGDLLG
ncbi:MAG: methionyl-tRNA formyltransferase [Candidatus Omnitrophica bacterium]|nr:methionyl-tRNA formyltransferase [Candidatus Omnitrophota bacterium]